MFSTEGLPAGTAVFTEPTACAMHGLETLAVRPGASALVFGAGPTGLLLARLIAAGGASSVTVGPPGAVIAWTATRPQGSEAPEPSTRRGVPRDRCCGAAGAG